MTTAIAMTHNSKVVNRGYLIIFNMWLHMITTGTSVLLAYLLRR
jgi:hypothetical protein